MTRDILDGAPIVIVPAQRSRVHLPALSQRPPQLAAPVTLEEVLEAGGSPGSWMTQCGVRGGVFLYGSLFYLRVPCAKCLAASTEKAAA